MSYLHLCSSLIHDNTLKLFKPHFFETFSYMKNISATIPLPSLRYISRISIYIQQFVEPNLYEYFYLKIENCVK